MKSETQVEIVVVPPFVPPPPPETTYTWWTWHPRYPKWSKTCWGGPTIEKAYEALDRFLKHQYYHNKLIMFDGVTYKEVADLPCQRLDVWRKCIEADREDS